MRDNDAFIIANDRTNSLIKELQTIYFGKDGEQNSRLNTDNLSMIYKIQKC